MTDMPPPPSATDPQGVEGPPPSIQDLLEEAIDLVARSRPLPMSTTVKVNRDDLLDILELARDELPEEVKAAQWLLKEKDDFLAGARRERDEIVNQGQSEATRLVEQQEVIRMADARALQIVEEARAAADQLERQVDDYCDQKLAKFEIILEKTARTVQAGREKLLGPLNSNPMGLSEVDDPFAEPL